MRITLIERRARLHTSTALGLASYTTALDRPILIYALIDALRNGDSSGNGMIELSEFVAHVQGLVPKLSAELESGIVKGAALIAMRGFKNDKQSAHFGSTGEDFALVRRLQ